MQMRVTVSAALAVGLGVTAWPASGAVVFQDTFESGTINTSGRNWRGEWWTGVPGAPRMEAMKGARGGLYGLRASLFRNDEYVSNSNRSEVRKTTHSTDAIGMGNNGQTRYYRWNVFVPNDYVAETQSEAFEIVGQLHRGPTVSGQDWRSPPFSVEIKNGRWTLVNNRVGGTRVQDAGAVTPGEWTEWMVRTTWSPNSDGQLRVWKNGSTAWNVSGANTWGTDHSTGDHYLKVGLYKPEWRDTDTGFVVRSDTWRRTFLFDDVKVGDGNENYDSMRTTGSPIATQLFTLGTHANGADAQVMGADQGRHLLNAGGATRAEVRGNNWAGGEYAAYLRFDLSPITLPSIADATLQLVVQSDAAHTLDVYAVPDGFAGRNDGFGAPELSETAWVEGNKNWATGSGNEITGDNAPGFNEVTGTPDTSVLQLLGSVTLNGGLRNDSLIELSTAALIDAVAADTNDRLTLAIFGRDQNGVITQLRTREASTDWSPSLEVIARSTPMVIPEPAALLAAPLGVLLLRRRRSIR